METIGTSHPSEDVHISGMVKIPIEFECQNLHVSGKTDAYKSLRVHGNLHTSGLFNSDGPIIVEKNIHDSGKSTYHNSVHIMGDFKSSGIINCENLIEVGGNLHNSGWARLKQNVIVKGSMESSGNLSISGHLFANEIKLVGSHGIMGMAETRIDGSIYAAGPVDLKRYIVRGNIIAPQIKLELPKIQYLPNPLILHRKLFPPLQSYPKSFAQRAELSWKSGINIARDVAKRYNKELKKRN
jgi:hypothetical protein